MALQTEMADETQFDDGTVNGCARSSALLEVRVKLSRTVGCNESFLMLKPIENAGFHRLYLWGTGSSDPDISNLPGQLAGLGKSVGLVTAGIPSLIAGLLKAVPVAEGDVVELTKSIAQPVEIDEVHLGRLIFVVGFALKIDSAAVGQHDPRPVIERSKVEPADPTGWISELLPLQQRAGQQDGVVSQNGLGVEQHGEVWGQLAVFPLKVIGQPEAAGVTVVVVARNHIDRQADLADPPQGL